MGGDGRFPCWRQALRAKLKKTAGGEGEHPGQEVPWGGVGCPVSRLGTGGQPPSPTGAVALGLREPMGWKNMSGCQWPCVRGAVLGVPSQAGLSHRL